MTRPRAALVCVSDTPYYHCIGRCVRRAYLYGEDKVTGRSFTHRRDWLLARLRLLTESFAIELCAYALMSNHYHLVVRIAAESAAQWSPEEVVSRWCRVFGGPAWAKRLLGGAELTNAEQALRDAAVPKWRARLASLSWFMRCLNEWLARKANQEDNCTGRFWEGRFKSQALLDDAALLTAMAYVDLNPVRAGIADTLIEADFTSIQQRMFEIARSARADTKPETIAPPRLLPMADAIRQQEFDTLPFNLQDYLDLVDAAGRQIRTDQRGVIPAHQPLILTTLGLMPDEWFKTVTQLRARFELFMGSAPRLRALAKNRGWRWVRGIAAGQRLYRRANE